MDEQGAKGGAIHAAQTVVGGRMQGTVADPKMWQLRRSAMKLPGSPLRVLGLTQEERIGAVVLGSVAWRL